MSQLLDFGIYDKQITFVVNKDIAREKVPCFVFPIGIPSFFGHLLKPQRSHIGVNHYLLGWLSIGNPRLKEDRLHGATVETGKSVERIGGIWKNNIVKQYLPQQRNNAAVVIEKIVYL